ncbi:cold shock domain-containing protein [Stappia stellulata]|uniref:cold shock domain-containing protein n=1 Tax=Stappia stellulata TaxID=71235 RepID=UPI000421B504|nr:cold shock domain-containing protein [Stappia stellulata]
MELGNVKWFDLRSGVGQIQADEGDFVHVDIDAVRKAGQATLREGQLVAYDLEYARGTSVADNLRVL